MVRWVFYLFIAVVIALVLTIFAGVDTGLRFSLGQEFSLKIGQTAFITDEELSIKFVAVTEDSRCPQGAVCVWEGRVSCLVQLAYGSTSETIVLTQSGTTDQYSEEAYQEYTLAFRVQPYPEVGKEIEDSEYRLYLIIER